jgi:tyrosine decarboxylase/aspartate 1-decarboxylase
MRAGTRQHPEKLAGTSRGHVLKDETAMKSKGRSRREVLSELRRASEEDAKYENGRILCSMTTKPKPIAKAAHRMFLASNLGDPGLFQGTRRLEQEAVHTLANLLNGRKSVGFIVSGGTEANLMALWAARNTANVSDPEVVVPESAHFSFDKVCNILKLKLVRAALDETYRVSPKAVERCMSDRTVAIVGTAGTSELGVVDPIGDLSKIALEHDVHLHVDAAFGGLVIPFLEPKLRDSLAFDFRFEGVKSLTVDPHKMGMAPIPAGGILFRDKASLDCIKTETPYLTETPQYTFGGTRSGPSAAATWAVFESLGREGFRKTAKHCITLTGYLSKEIRALGLQLVVEPTLNIVAFQSSNSKETAETLRRKGWFVSYVPRLNCVRIVVMPHARKRHMQAFLADLKTIVL